MVQNVFIIIPYNFFLVSLLIIGDFRMKYDAQGRQITVIDIFMINDKLKFQTPTTQPKVKHTCLNNALSLIHKCKTPVTYS